MLLLLVIYMYYNGYEHFVLGVHWDFQFDLVLALMDLVRWVRKHHSLAYWNHKHLLLALLPVR